MGASEEEAARRAGTTVEQYRRWEAGEIAPTIGQLRSLSKSFRQPFGIFLRKEPPKLTQPIPRDFRGHQGVAVPRNDTSLAIQLNTAERRREIALGLFEDIGESPPQFNFQLDRNTGPEQAGHAIRNVLGITFQKQRVWRTGERSLSELKTLIESAGVLIGQFTRLDLDQARGASLSEFPLPIILLNPRDPPVARTFTLMHELVHVALHASGVCNIVEEYDRPPEEQALEVYCNAVAGAALVPVGPLNQLPMVRARPGVVEWSDEEIDAIKREFGVSRFVVLRRLLELGRTTRDYYSRRHAEWLAELKAIPERQDAIVPPHRMAISSCGRSFSKLVVRALHENVITLSDAADFLGTKAKNIGAIEGEVF
ncbi:MAG: ImmA/IrrE family metallo-endopeptidase [Sphingomonas sp.]|nr:ImmA/IrrE family metallo-endopeptidase [Sphingomonas sp.]